MRRKSYIEPCHGVRFAVAINRQMGDTRPSPYVWVSHESLESARSEAKRLARLNWCTTIAVSHALCFVELEYVWPVAAEGS